MPKCVIHDKAVAAGLIEMKDMKPLQTGRVVDEGDDYNGHLVLRTQRGKGFEFMDLTDFKESSNWEGSHLKIKVRLLKEPITITLSNDD